MARITTTPGAIVQQQVDIVSGNIGQAVDFLAPRAQGADTGTEPVGDSYFPIYKGEQFYKLWEQLSNVNTGLWPIKPDGFTGPSGAEAKRWGSASTARMYANRRRVPIRP